MDDDLVFGASVWGANAPEEQPNGTFKPEASLKPASELEDNSFDDFDDFGPPEDTSTVNLKDDDFGDFGDFGEADAVSSVNLGDDGFEEDSWRVAGPSSNIWRPLQLDPFPSRSSLEREIDETLAPIWNNEDIANVTADQGIREAEGVAQIIITQSR